MTTAQQQIAGACSRLGELGLFVGTAGNISSRVGDLVAITVSGADLSSPTVDDVVVVDLDGVVVAGTARPSSELELHLGVYRNEEFSGVGAIVHTHSKFATTLSTVVAEVPVIHYQQLGLGGTLRVAPYFTFGTAELADAVHTALSGRMGALMANHGAVALGLNVDGAADNAILLEWLCEVFWRADLLGSPHVLTEAQQAGVVEHALAIGYGQRVTP